MFYTHVLLSKRDNKFYIGHTKNLTERIERHHGGRVPATKHRMPLELVHSEFYKTKSEAARRERYLKSLKASSYFHRIIGV